MTTIAVSSAIGIILGIVAAEFYIHLMGPEGYDLSYSMRSILIFSAIFLLLGIATGIRRVQKRSVDILENLSIFAVISLAAAIVSILFFWLIILAQIIAIGAIICGMMGLAHIRRDNALKGENLAVYGIILAILHLIALAGFFLFTEVL